MSDLETLSNGYKMTNNIVSLNVGGKVFLTSRLTLLRECFNVESSEQLPNFFSAILNDDIPTQLTSEGHIFIDRSPKLFEDILSYLRSGRISLQSLRKCYVKELRIEAEFYGLSSLSHQLKLMESASSFGAKVVSHSSSSVNAGPCNSLLFHSKVDPPVCASGDVFAQMVKTCSTYIVVLYSSSEKVAAENKVAIYTSDLNHDLIISHCYSTEDFNCRAELMTVELSKIQSESSEESETSVTNDVTKYSIFVALAYKDRIQILNISLSNNSTERCVTPIGVYRMSSDLFRIPCSIRSISFVGTQLIVLSKPPHFSKIGVWNSRSRVWKTQDLKVPITSYDILHESVLCLGCYDGSIKYINMEKFPQRIPDNDLLFSELHRMEHHSEPITAVSVYSPFELRRSVNSNQSEDLWYTVEIAYGTQSGKVRVLVESNHSSTLIHQRKHTIFQEFTVHCSPVVNVKLSDKYLISVCASNNHVRSWRVARFRGAASTQPGLTSVASYSILSLDTYDVDDNQPEVHDSSDVNELCCEIQRFGSLRSTKRSIVPSYTSSLRRNGAGEGEMNIATENTWFGDLHHNHIGPFGPCNDFNDPLLFVQKVVPHSNTLFIRSACDGERICKILLTQVSNVYFTSYTIHECLERSAHINDSLMTDPIAGDSLSSVHLISPPSISSTTCLRPLPRRRLITAHSDGSIFIWDLTTAIDIWQREAAHFQPFGSPSVLMTSNSAPSSHLRTTTDSGLVQRGKICGSDVDGEIEGCVGNRRDGNLTISEMIDIFADCFVA